MSKKTKSAATLVTFLLDRSSSMSPIRDQTIEAFNGYLLGLKDDKDAKIDFTFLQFDDNNGLDILKVFVAEPIANVPEITHATYAPRGCTPLIDAAYKTIVATQTAIDKRDDKPKVVICIQTDGEENASKAHNWEQLSALIKLKTEQGWQFNFLGCGIDAYAQGARMGVAAAQTMSYDRFNGEATRSAFRSTGRNTSSFAAGLSANTAYSAGDRLASMDAFTPPDLQKQQQVAAKVTVTTTVTPAAVVRSTTLDLTKQPEDLTL